MILPPLHSSFQTSLTEQKQQQNTHPPIFHEESKVEIKTFKMKWKVRRMEQTGAQS